ncbi:MAG: 4-(cytidine 5'-diphospho)-2-C-methyl-D-erythritol kinase [Acidobacteria bacterium]|nr:MAG: 4-(cytidine 5'-diphospho)-2-C-methyl-D-erythritol kinase [Acidobacteriota bacterium]
MTNPLVIRIPAKINLHLEVVGRRPDGFHELRTLFQSVDLYDTLRGWSADEGRLDLEIEPGNLVSAGGDNLVLKAAQALWVETGRRPGARLKLKKRIPVGGGMGGGSADAAGALILLNRLWSLHLPPSDLRRLAVDLGSDVPFFLHGGLALGVGRGEEVIPLEDLPALGVLLVVPPVEVSTPEVFRRIEARPLVPGTWKRMDDRVYAGVVNSPPLIDWSVVGNDLERVVCEGWPQVAEALEGVRRLSPLFSTVSGSGATVFGVFESFDVAAGAADGLKVSGRVEVVEMRGRIRAKPEAVLEDENRGKCGNY